MSVEDDEECHSDDITDCHVGRPPTRWSCPQHSCPPVLAGTHAGPDGRTARPVERTADRTSPRCRDCRCCEPSCCSCHTCRRSWACPNRPPRPRSSEHKSTHAGGRNGLGVRCGSPVVEVDLGPVDTVGTWLSKLLLPEAALPSSASHADHPDEPM